MSMHMETLNQRITEYLIEINLLKTKVDDLEKKYGKSRSELNRSKRLLKNALEEIGKYQAQVEDLNQQLQSARSGHE